tara:strand:- start:2411 stop:4018 length:1608 start_codon:yes stop_codon:yes gene_type:complete
MNTFIITNIQYGEASIKGNPFNVYLDSDPILSKKKCSLYKKGDKLLISTGYLTSNNGYKNSDDLVDFMQYNSSETIKKYDGMYSFCFISSSQLSFFTDMFGLEKLFIYQKGEQFAVSNKLLFMAQFLNQMGEFEFDHHGLLEWLIYGCAQSDQTPIKNIVYAKPGTFYQFKEGQLIESSEIDMRTMYIENKKKYVGRTTGDLFDECEDIITRNIENYLKGNKKELGCYLSSGLDSRMNAWALNKLNRSYLGITYDCGTEEDTLSSLQYGALTGNPIINGFMARSEEMGVHLNTAANCFDFTQPAENCQFFPLANHLSKNIDVIMDGTSGDIFFGGIFHGKKNYPKKSFGPLSFLNNQEHLNYDDCFMHNLETRQRYWIIPGLQALYSFAEPFSTIYNKELVKFCFSLPEELLLNRSFHRKFLQEKAPSFSKILSDSYNRGLNQKTLTQKIVRKLKQKLSKKEFFKDQMFCGIDQDKYFLNVEGLGISKETYGFISEISKKGENELKRLPVGKQTYFLNFQEFNKQIRHFKCMMSS